MADTRRIRVDDLLAEISGAINRSIGRALLELTPAQVDRVRGVLLESGLLQAMLLIMRLAAPDNARAQAAAAALEALEAPAPPPPAPHSSEPN